MIAVVVELGGEVVVDLFDYERALAVESAVGGGP